MKLSCLRMLAIALTIGLICVSDSELQDKEENDTDDTLLAQYKSGELLAPAEVWNLHENAKAGQGAVFKDFEGIEQTFRIASLEKNVCIVEHRLPDSNVVLATEVEVEVEGVLANMVQRAWIGRMGEKPTEINIAVSKSGSGGWGRSVPVKTKKTEFKNRKQGGLKWSGTLRTDTFYKTRAYKKVMSVRKYWDSKKAWFNSALWTEIEKDGETQTSGITEASLKFSSLMDWSRFPKANYKTRRKIRTPLLEQVAKAKIKSAVAGRLGFGNYYGLHPNAEVGDWAVYNNEFKLTLVSLDAKCAIVERTELIDELKIVEAIEFSVVKGKAGGVIKRHVGLYGDKPTEARYSTWTASGMPETSYEKYKDVKYAGKSWRARSGRTEITRLNKNEEKELFKVTKFVECKLAPFGYPLETKYWYDSKPEDVTTTKLTGTGNKGRARLKWKEYLAEAK